MLARQYASISSSSRPGRPAATDSGSTSRFEWTFFTVFSCGVSRRRSGDRRLFLHRGGIQASGRGGDTPGAVQKGALPGGDVFRPPSPGAERLVLKRAPEREGEVPGFRAWLLVDRIQVRRRLERILPARQERDARYGNGNHATQAAQGGGGDRLARHSVRAHGARPEPVRLQGTTF